MVHFSGPMRVGLSYDFKVRGHIKVEFVGMRLRVPKRRELFVVLFSTSQDMGHRQMQYPLGIAKASCTHTLPICTKDTPPDTQQVPVALCVHPMRIPHFVRSYAIGECNTDLFKERSQ